ncbi:MAG TPA: DUF551 domain-containing protein [Microvirga sp.]|nr:DUF551 domain-containing protein [Microvirga sp.]
MTPTDEQVERAIAAFDDTWRKRPDITVKNFHDARRDAMRAALRTVTVSPPPLSPSLLGQNMTELVKRLIELREKARALSASEFWLDNNHPWRIMATRGGSHYAVAEQHPESAPGDGEWRDGKTICDALNELLAIRTEINTIIAALSTPGGEWKPIETAPKDGTKVLAVMPGGFKSVVWYDAQFAYEYNDEKGESDYRGAWTDGTVASFAYEELTELNPTHWMPLPASPLSKENEHG